MILQPGAFNPVHYMHFAIADDAKKHFPGYYHSFVLASQTCDKGIIPEEELKKRMEPIKEAGYNAYITESGLFIDHVKSIRKQEEAVITKNGEKREPLQIVFAVGEDTLHRFFRDWEKFFENSVLSRTMYYEINFENVVWYVTKRTTKDSLYQELVDKYLGYYNNIIWSDLAPDSISSSQIREEATKRAENLMRLKGTRSDEYKIV